MGYDLCWGLRRDRALDDKEVDLLREHVEAVAKQIDGYNLSVAPAPMKGWVALGTLRPKREEIEEVQEELLDAMGRLRTVVSDATLVIRDDHAEYVWNRGGWDADTESEADVPLPLRAWRRLEAATREDDSDDDDDDDDSAPRPRDIYELGNHALVTLFDDPVETEARRLEALDRLIMHANKDSRLTLGLIARARDEQPQHMARIMAKLGEHSTIQPLPTVLLAIDAGVANTTRAWAKLRSRQVDRVVPWLPATPAGRALVWLHTPGEADLVGYLRERGGHPSDAVFEAWRHVDVTFSSAQLAGGRGVFDDFTPYSTPLVVSAIDDLLEAIERFEREHGPVIQHASAGAQRLVSYHQTRSGEPPVALTTDARDLTIALAVALGAENQAGFLTDRARRELLAYEFTMSVPTPAEIEAGLGEISGVS